MSIAKRKVELSLGRSHLILLNQRQKSGLTVDNEATDKLKFVKTCGGLSLGISSGMGEAKTIHF